MNTELKLRKMPILSPSHVFGDVVHMSRLCSPLETLSLSSVGHILLKTNSMSASDAYWDPPYEVVFYQLSDATPKPCSLTVSGATFKGSGPC